MLLKVGSTGEDVRNLQNVLNLLGMASPLLVVDGIFGQKTRAAVVAFQQSFKLAADGIVGPMTMRGLMAATFIKLGVKKLTL